VNFFLKHSVVVLELPYSTGSGEKAESLRVGAENMENLMTVVDRLDELQASYVHVGRRDCSSTRQQTGARRMDDGRPSSCGFATRFRPAFDFFVENLVANRNRFAGSCAY